MRAQWTTYCARQNSLDWNGLDWMVLDGSIVLLNYVLVLLKLLFLFLREVFPPCILTSWWCVDISSVSVQYRYIASSCIGRPQCWFSMCRYSIWQAYDTGVLQFANGVIVIFRYGNEKALMDENNRPTSREKCRLFIYNFYRMVNFLIVIVSKSTRSLAIAKRACDCCIILKSGSYTKAI